MHATRSAKPVALSQALKLGLNLLGLITVSRVLGPAEFGLFAMIAAVLGIGELVRDAGLSLAAIRASELDSGQQANLFWINLGVGAALTALAAALSGPIAALYGQPSIAGAVAVTAVTFVLNGAAAQHRVRLVRDDRFSALASTDVASQAVGLALALTLALAGAGLWALVAQAVGIAVTGLTIVLARTRWLPGPPSRNADIRSLLGFGGNLLGTQMLSYLGRNVDNVLLGRFAGAVQLGQYSKAYTLYALPQQVLLAPFTDLVVRTLSASRADRALYLRRVEAVQRAANYVTLMAFGTMIALAHPIVSLLLGPEWGDTASLLQILSVGGIFQLIGYVNYWIFLTEGMSGLHLRMTLVTQPIAIACIALGVPFGARGVAWGATVGLVIEWIVPATYGTARSSVAARALLLSTIRPLVFAGGFATAAAAAAAAVPGPAVVQILAGVLGAAIFAVAALLLWPGLRRDGRALAGSVRTVAHRPASRAYETAA